jgi:L-serine dehydratase
MSISIFDLFSIGIGPSSSHTVGPMRAAKRFAHSIHDKLDAVARVAVSLHGSLAFTGKGHGSDKAILLGLEGYEPETIEPDFMQQRFAAIVCEKSLVLLGEKPLMFGADDLRFDYAKELPHHPNGMRFCAYDAQGTLLLEAEYYSIGGGFISTRDDFQRDKAPASAEVALPMPFSTGDELLAICKREGCSVADIMMKNEMTWRSADEIRQKLLAIADVMFKCIDLGCDNQGVLAGGLGVKRRAYAIHKKLLAIGPPGAGHPQAMNWMNLYAMAVNEQNAAGARVVTAPTNGAAGIIPAVLRYHQEFVSDACEQHIIDYLLTAGAIVLIYKENASISGAEMGCQGEVGVACSMAAGALAAIMGGTPMQVEHAAEIGMEHNLGLTCDPIGGLVQIPCIERNAMGAVHAVNAANLAMVEEGEHKVSLDDVIKTMYEVGCNMHSMYKETSRGGLATTVNIVEC